MQDISTTDFGTWYSDIAPSPDTPLSLAWGSAVARNVAKITKGSTYAGTRPIDEIEVPIVFQYPQQNNTRMPFVKAYVYDTGVYTDFPLSGRGCTLQGWSNSIAWLKASGPSQIEMYIGTFSFPFACPYAIFIWGK